MSAIALERPEISGFIFNIMRFATHDGPGIRTTVFFKGCPLACWWCHNPESQSFVRIACISRSAAGIAWIASPHARSRPSMKIDGVLCTTDACTFAAGLRPNLLAEARQIAGRRYTLGELMAEKMEKDIVFFDDSGGGVTLSGGLPVCQRCFSLAFLAPAATAASTPPSKPADSRRPETFRRLAAARRTWCSSISNLWIRRSTGGTPAFPTS